jgi:hypothetical protein
MTVSRIHLLILFHASSPAISAFFAIEAAWSARLALYAALALFSLSILTSAAFLSWMRRAAA